MFNECLTISARFLLQEFWNGRRAAVSSEESEHALPRKCPRLDASSEAGSADPSPHSSPGVGHRQKDQVGARSIGIPALQRCRTAAVMITGRARQAPRLIERPLLHRRRSFRNNNEWGHLMKVLRVMSVSVVGV